MSIDKLLKSGTRIAIDNKFGTIETSPDGMETTIIYDDQNRVKVPRLELIDHYTRGLITILNDRSEIESIAPSINYLDTDKLTKLAIKSEYVSDFKRSGFKLTRDKMQRSIDQTTKRLNLGPDHCPPCVSTLHNWVKKTKERGGNAHPMNALAPQVRRRNKRIPDDIENLMNDVIHATWLTRKKKSKSHSYRCLVKACKIHLGIDIGDKHRQTFNNRIEDIDPGSVTRARSGSDEARTLAHVSVSRVETDTILDSVEIDAVHLGVGLVDDKGSYIGFPVVHIVIDVHSRAVLGFSIELSSETSGGVVESLKSALTLKNKYLDFPYTKNEWPMYGRMLQIIHDGGSAQLGEMVGTFLGVCGISHTTCQTRTPYYKPVVERFNRTLRDNFADHLPGYVGTMDNPKGQEHIIKKAAQITFSEFKKELTKYIIDDYNQAPHSAYLGRSPYSRWTECSLITPPVPIANIELASKLHGNWTERTYDATNGIRLNNVWYNDKEGKLHDLYLRLSPKEKKKKVFECLYNTTDISSITVKINNSVIVASARKTEGYIPMRKNMSLGEYNAERKRLREDSIACNKATGGTYVNYGVESEFKINTSLRATLVRANDKKNTKKSRPKPVINSANKSKESADVLSKKSADITCDSQLPEVLEDASEQNFDGLAELLKKAINSTEA